MNTQEIEGMVKLVLQLGVSGWVIWHLLTKTSVEQRAHTKSITRLTRAIQVQSAIVRDLAARVGISVAPPIVEDDEEEVE